MSCEIIGLFFVHILSLTFSTVGIALYIHKHIYIYVYTVRCKRFWGQDLVVWGVGVVSQAWKELGSREQSWQEVLLSSQLVRS